jgi:hypothetical protein
LTQIECGALADSWSPGYLYIYQPQLAERSLYLSSTTDNAGLSTYTDVRLFHKGGVFNADTQFDGFSMLTPTGNLTGTIEIYGLEK